MRNMSPMENVIMLAYWTFTIAGLAYSVYLILNFRKNLSDYPIVFSKRYPRLLYALVVAIWVSTFVAAPLNALGHMREKHTERDMLSLPASVILSQFFMATVYMVFAMIWMVRFEIKVTKWDAQRKWKMYLDGDWDKQCWFVRNRTSIGRLAMVLRGAAFVWFIFAVPYILLFLMGNYAVASKIILAQSAPPVLSGLRVWWNTPDIGDFFHLRQQAKWLVLAMIVQCAAYTSLINLLDEKANYSSFLFGILFVAFSPTFLFLLLDYPVRLHLRNFSDMKETTTLEFLETLSTNDTSRQSFWGRMSGGPVTPSSKTEEKIRRRSSVGRQMMRELIATDLGFEAFMEHLMKEFSFENLLFIVEVTQFKEVLLAKFPQLKKTSGLNHGMTATIASAVPNSVTIHDDTKSPREKAQYLYDKYIDPAAILEVNIAYELRVRLGRIFGDESYSGSSTPNDSPPPSNHSTPRSSLQPLADTPSFGPRASSEMNALDDVVRVNSESHSAQIKLPIARDMNDEKELYEAFDNAYKQIMTLLLDSFSRFQRSSVEQYVGSV